MRTKAITGLCLLAGFLCLAGMYRINQPPQPDLTGTMWQLDYSMEIHQDTSFRHVPKAWLRIKSFSKHRFMFTGYDLDRKTFAGIGGGTYSWQDSSYREEIEYHHEARFIGGEFTGTLYLDSIYLYQRGRVGELLLEERWRRID